MRGAGGPGSHRWAAAHRRLDGSTVDLGASWIHHPVGNPLRRFAEEAGILVRDGSPLPGLAGHDLGPEASAADGSTEVGTHVVVTVPLGVLKLGSLRFTPTLPADRTTAIRDLGFGHYEKVAMHFDRPFRRNAGLGHVLTFPCDPVEATMWVINQDAFGAGPTLVCQVFHSGSHHVVGRSEAEAADWALGMPAHAVGWGTPTARCRAGSARRRGS